MSEPRAASPHATPGLMRLARTAWYPCWLLTWGILALALAALLLAGPGGLYGGQPLPEPSTLRYALDVVATLGRVASVAISLILAGVVHRRRPAYPMALFLAYFLLVYAIVLSGPLSFFEPLWPGINQFNYGVLQPILLAPLLVALLGLFPNGRFVPGQARWLAAAAGLYGPTSALVFSPGPPPALAALYAPGVLAWFALIGAGLWAQVYRYRHVSSAAERQQTRWVLFGFAVTVLLVVLLAAVALATGDAPLPWWAWPLGSLGWSLAALVLPVALAFAMLRYRLYDVDLIINRALVYGALTAGVVSVYVLTVGAAGLVVQTDATLSALLITAVVGAIAYRPVRTLLQAHVDRLVSGQAGAAPPFSRVRAPYRAPPQQDDAGAPPNSAPRPSARWPRLARLAWYPAFAMALGIFVVAVPGFATLGSSGSPDPRFSPNLSPLVRGLVWSTLAGAAATGLLSLWLAALLFRRRAGDRMALMTSFFLLAHGVIAAGPLKGLEPFFPGIARFTQNVLLTMFVPASLLLFAVFPDGRFVPGWMRWVVAASFPAIPFALFWTSLYTAAPLDFSQPVVLVSTVVVILLAVAVWVSTLYAQIYRYRRVSTPEQRQQTKWVVYGIGLWLTLQIVLSIPWTYAFSLPAGTPYPLWLAAAGPFWIVSIALIPVTLTIAVMRYRLFQIDLIINRTLVFGALTASVVALYVLLVGALGMLVQTRQGNLMVTLLATALVAVLFQPLRERLQRAVNRLTYGSRDDPVAVFARLGELLQATASPQQMLPGLVRTVAETLRLPYAAIELDAGGERQVVAAFGRPGGELERFPLVFQKATIGSLVAAPRTGSADFGPADLELLTNVAQQAGAVAHAVQLTQALQRSRARLVTAREEERRRLRRDLHDELGPQLASQTLLIQALERRIGKDPASALPLLGELQKQSQKAVDDIRRIVYDLRPPALDELGLLGALREALSPYQRSGARVVVKGPEALPALPAAVEVAAYRIVQEAVTNVFRHARASRCTVRLDYAAGPTQPELRLAVEDDGVGLPAEHASGVGLQSMRERAAELGGELSIESRDGGGTQVYACLPVVEARP